MHLSAAEQLHYRNRLLQISVLLALYPISISIMYSGRISSTTEWKPVENLKVDPEVQD